MTLTTCKMAENTNNLRAMEVFWSRDDDSFSGLMEKPYVPGIEKAGNRRPGRQSRNFVKGRKTMEVKAEIPVKQPVVENMPASKREQETAGNNMSKSSKASLKDLCAEDKKRVANLIRELARLGDEKENMTDQIQKEREQFEDEIKQLSQQQNIILHERESIQTRLLDCQSLLAKYQQQLTEQLDKMSIQKEEDDVQKKSQELSRKSPRYQEKEYGPPSRTHYPQNMDEEKFARLPRQHTNFDVHGHVLSNPGISDVPSSLPQSSKVSTNQLPDVPLSMPHSGYYHNHPCSYHVPHHNQQEVHCNYTAPLQHPVYNPPPMPPAEAPVMPAVEVPLIFNKDTRVKSPDVSQVRNGMTSERPFTTMIDNLIAHEKDKAATTIHGEGQQQINSNPRNHALTSTRGQHPMSMVGPLDEPVMTSTQRSEYQTPTMQGSKSEQYHLLEPDNSSVNYASDLPQMLGSDPNHKLPQHREQGIAENERQKELLQQKELLLQEQDRLRSVLANQEKLLDNKQKQLHQQQINQQQRLVYFQRTGYFPPPDWDGHTYPASEYDGDSPCLSAPDTIVQSLNQDDQKEEGLDSVLDACSNGLHDLNNSFSEAEVLSDILNSTNFNMDDRGAVANRLNGQALESVHFARGTKAVGTSPYSLVGSDQIRPSSVSVGTSPIHQRIQNTGIQSEQTNRTVINRFSEQPQRKPQSLVTTQSHSQSPFSDNFSGEYGAGLLDIVNQVESEHNTSYEALPHYVSHASRLSRHTPLSNKPEPIIQQGRQKVQEANSEIEEEQESQVLEDIFFIR